MAIAHRIKVLGRELQVRSEAPPEAVRDVESFVNARLAQVASATQGGDLQVVAILTLMNLAEEYLASRRDGETAHTAMTSRLQRLLQRLDELPQ